MNIHFISGLPRSGSTLLTSIFNQNPCFHALGISSALAPLINRIIFAMGATSENYYLINENQRKNVITGIFESYYKEIPSSQIVLDTNRFWCANLSLLNTLYPRSKVIVCVRDLNAILDSFEILVAKNPLVKSRLFSPSQSFTMQTRVNALLEPNGVVGFAWNATQSAFFGEHRDNLIFLEYEALARNPESVMRQLYSFLNIDQFSHDFRNVSFNGMTPYDYWLGAPSLHSVSPTVRFEPRQSILTPAILRQNSGKSYWRMPELNRNNAKVILPDI